MRSQLVLELAVIDADVVVFMQDETVVELEFDRERWIEMGEPTFLTVTIEPGDRLNDAPEQQVA